MRSLTLSQEYLSYVRGQRDGAGGDRRGNSVDAGGLRRAEGMGDYRSSVRLVWNRAS